MTINIKYIDNGIGIEIIASGFVTGEEIIKAHQEIYHTQNLERQKYQLIDRTECTEYNVSTEEVKQIAAIDNAAAKSNPDIVIAIIAPTDIQFGMSRVWQVHVEESKLLTQIFRDRISAENWISEQINTT